jgi:hypothetical protein
MSKFERDIFEKLYKLPRFLARRELGHFGEGSRQGAGRLSILFSEEPGFVIN